jgi:Glyoxalase superfamily protein
MLSRMVPRGRIRFNSVIPVLRIFNIAKGDEFYLGFLGFNVDWDHRVDPIAPLCRQISRGSIAPIAVTPRAPESYA